MSYKRSKFFSISNKKKIKYLFINKKSQIVVVYFHGFDVISRSLLFQMQVFKPDCFPLTLPFILLQFLLHNYHQEVRLNVY